MRVTIIRNDNMVYVDGNPRVVDCSSLAPEVHAVQWYDTWGELEININGCHSNTQIKDMSPFQALIDAHALVPQKAREAAEAAAPGGVTILA